MRPPRLARTLLRLSRHGGRRTEIDEDLADLFDSRATNYGKRYARRRYWADVFSFYAPRHHRQLTAAMAAAPGHEGAGMMAGFWFDLRHVLRSTRRQPAFFAVAALTLGIGFAAHFAAFGIVDRLLLSGPPHVAAFEDVFRLHVDRADVLGGRFLWYQTPYRAYEDLRRNTRSFAAMGAYRTATASMGSGAEARQVAVVFADHHYFPLLGVSARLGRVFTEEDDRAPAGNPVAVLSDAFWRGAFGADPGALGRTVRIGAKTYTIIGVAPPAFTGDNPQSVDVWAPFHAGAYELNPVWTSSFLFRSVTVLTRLAPGVTQAMASEEVAATYRRISDGTPAADQTARIVLAPLSPGRTQQGTLTQSGRIAIWLEGVSLLVLLVAIANVINLLMSRAAQQRREMAVRVALGAGRGRLLARIAIEMLIIAGAGALTAAALTYWSATALQQLLLPGTPGVISGARFGWVAAATLIGATAICVIFASLQVRMGAVSERLKSGRGGDGFSRARLRQGLLVAQVVMSALLLIGAGLFLRSIVKLGEVDFGHDQDRVLVATIPLRGAGYTDDASEAFYERALRELATVPGVEEVAAAHTTPFAPSQSAELFIPGFERLPFAARGYPTFYTVTPRFFSTMGMRILRGRAFTDADRAGAAPVIILEDALAQTLWPGQDPLGKCIIVGAANRPCREIVGVSSNTRRFLTQAAGSLRYYLPMGQRLVTAPPQAMFVRTAGDPAALAPSVRAALLRVDANLPFAQLRVLEQLAEPDRRPWKLGSTLFIVFGAAALFVATAGVYALLSFMVAQRSREIGVRLALGASRRRTLWLVVRQSLGWITAGLVAGIAVALACGRFLEPLLFETSPYDVTVFAWTAVVLLLIALAAAAAPAIRASRVDPNVALRAE